MIRINEQDEEELRNLYEDANRDDTTQSWTDVRNYMHELGKKYGFNEKKVTINSRGEVIPIGRITIYIVYNNTSHRILQAYRSKFKAGKDIVNNNDLDFTEVYLD